jgi:hypothetical protein
MRTTMTLQDQTCQFFSKRLAATVEGEEPDDALAAHLAMCGRCRAEAEAYRCVDLVLRRRFTTAPGAALDTESVLRRLPAVAESGPMRARHVSRSSVAARRRGRTFSSVPRPLVSAVAATAAVAAIVAIAVGLFSGMLVQTGRSSGPSIAIPTATAEIALGSQAHFVDIQMVTPTEGWAVGYRAMINQPQSKPLLAHVANGRWTLVDVAYGGPLASIAVVAPDDIWAGGMPGSMLHYDGAAWRSVESPSAGSVNMIAMVGRTAGWAVGDPVDQHAGAFILHYDGTAWVQQPAPQMSGFVHLTGISMLSAEEGWAAGTVYPYDGTPASGVLLHFQLGQWRIATTLPSTTIRSVSMVSADQGWVVGSHDTYETSSEGTRATHTAMLLHYAGGHWELVPLAAIPVDPTAVFGAIRFDSPDDGWIVGSVSVGQGSSGTGLLLLHYTGGRWTQIDGPPSFHGESHSIDQVVPSAGGDLWLVGSQSVQPAQQPSDRSALPTGVPFLAHYLAGHWTQVTP